ncbi:hypothetical protein CVT24_006082 [Panaeolus cyanescens]|uniref:Pentacotripeptide-repeat region of PRORP domain-containing protein n=1 Tax=Panaeolus cyanescens TaxID=181874 RepID=A0A409VCS2_9AGAR|nr:hypothetical protein CVT24_006082 [Panaeolus cyanescens]
MITRVPKRATTGILDFLIPSVLCRATFSKNAWTQQPQPNSQQSTRDDPHLHRKIREQILAHSHNRHSSIPESSKDKYNKCLAQLQKSIRTKNFPTALDNWDLYDAHCKTLPDEGANCRLPDNLMQDMGRLFMIHLRNPRLIQQLDERHLALAEKYAISVSTKSSTALYACMLYHLDKTQPEQVIALYKTYDQIIGETYKQERPPPEDDISAVVVEEEQEDPPVDHGRTSPLLAVVAAYAMTNSFAEALKTYIATEARISGFHKSKFLRHLTDPALQKSVEQYLHRLTTASLVARPGSLSRHVINLGQASTIHTLEHLYNSILKAISGHEPYLAARPEELSETRFFAMTEVGWTSFQTAFIKAERADLAAKVWADLKTLNITPGVAMWTALLDTYADLRDSQQSMTTWNTMLQAGIKPDELSYRAIISVLFDDQLPDEGLNRFKEYQKSFKGHSEKTLSVYNTVLRGLLRLNRFQEASDLLSEMQKAGPKPDVVSYNTFMAYYARQNDFQSLSNVVNRMSQENISGDVVTFSTILTALLQAGKTDAPTTILSLMRKQGVQPNVATYTAIIDHQMRGHTKENLKAALMMLDKMEHDEGIKPNEVTYTSILAGLYRAQTSWLPRHQADALRKELVRRMKRLKLTFRLPTYHILIRSCLSSPDPQAHQDAIAYIEDMEREGIPRVQTTWYLLLAGLMQRKEWAVANSMVTKMLQSGHEPSYRVQKLIYDIRKHV